MSAGFLETVQALGDNRATLSELITQVRSSPGIIPFVGAGLSIPLGFPGWKAFLLEEAGRANVVGLVEALLAQGDFEGAAEEVARARGPAVFDLAIRSAYGSERFAGREVWGAAAVLPMLARGPVVTTNFDRVVEEVFRRAGRALDVVRGARRDEVTRAIQRRGQMLLKLHGDAEDGTDRILSRGDYDRHYGRALTRPLPRLLEQLLISSPVLFVGCSLEADRTVRVLERVMRKHPALRWYAIVESPAGDAFYAKQRYLGERNILPIWYPAGQHQHVELLLRHVAEQAGVASSTVLLGAGTPAVAENRARLTRYLLSLDAWASGRLTDFSPVAVTEHPSAVGAPFQISYRLSPLHPRGSPAAVAVPERSFESLAAALAEYGERILLLGAPGSGKTTLLLALARDAARRRLAGSAAPIPVLATLSQWDHRTPLHAWARSLLPAGLNFSGETVLYLFDGLDELGGERPENEKDPWGPRYDPRLRLLQALNTGMRDVPLVLTSRTREYMALREQVDLPGAVVLQPLSTEQVREYLGNHGRGDLWTLLEREPALLQLARTPLLLVMLAFTFDANGAAWSAEGLDEEKIFDGYIRARFAHESARARLPFDEPATRQALADVAAVLCLRPLGRDEAPRYLAADGFLKFGFAWTAAAGDAFLDFAQQMHFVQTSLNGSLSFLHLKLRDYCALPRLSQWLQADGIMTRLSAVRALRQIGGPVLSVFQQALRSGNPRVRVDAARALREVDDPAAVTLLMTALGDSDADVKWEARSVIAELGAAAVPSIVAGLRGEDRRLRARAVDALLLVGPQHAVRELLAAAADPDEDVRSKAVELLRRTTGPHARRVLTDAAADPYWRVRAEAAAALASFDDPEAAEILTRMLRDPDAPVRRAAAFALAAHPSASTARMLAAMVNPDSEPDAGVRAAVAETLGHMDDDAGTEALERALEDSHEDVRYAAVHALGRSNPGRSLPAVCRVLREDPHHLVREAAAVALREMRRDAAIPDLVRALGDSGIHVRAFAAEALGVLRAEAAVPHLLRLLTRDGDTDGRSAAEALGRIGSPAAVRGLIEFLRSDRSYKAVNLAEGKVWFVGGFCGNAVARVLEQVGTPEALAAVAEWPPRSADGEAG